MAKRGFRGRPKKSKSGGGGLGGKNPAQMMTQLQQMQQDMAETQEKLADEKLTVTAGGGAISITITGHQRVEAISIDPDLVDPEEIDMLQDMLIAGVNAAIEQSQAMAAEKMEGISGGLGLGNMGLGDLLGGL
ncbi:MAG TPA: YbaB/EbfC family nucleoid-associated protein [Anaerolineae bacterium]|nr:YbaB/EbfC family nucleoid-associated protein [Anaerolineae bacterium]